MGDAEAGDAGDKSGDGVDLKADASHEEPAGNTGIEDEAPVGETPDDAAINEDVDGLDVTKTNGESGAEEGHGDKEDGGDTTAEGGVEVADGGEENEMYRHVRELALEAINAVRCCGAGPETAVV